MAGALSVLRTSPWATCREPIVRNHLLIIMLFEYSVALYSEKMLIELRAPGLLRLLPEPTGGGQMGEKDFLDYNRGL